MIIVLKDNPDQKQLENLVSWLKSMGLDIHMSKGQSATIMGLIGDTAAVDIDLINALDIVETVKRVQEPYKNVNRKFHPEDTVVEVIPGVKIGGGNFQVIAGPCSVESEEQICLVAEEVKKAGLDPGSLEGKKAQLAIIKEEVDAYRPGGRRAGMFPERWLPASVIVGDTPFTEQNGMLNTTMKMVRGKVEKFYADRIEYAMTVEGKDIMNQKNIDSL